MNPMPNRLPTRTVAPQRGFSLIEVLVSMFIVSLGILALSGLMQASSRYGKTSELRSTATLLANDLADHIRANPVGASQASYNLTAGYLAVPTITVPSPTTCTQASPCSANQLAAVDVYNWLTRVNATLPGGDAFVEYHAPGAAAVGPKGSVDVWVAWTDPTPGAERQTTECAANLNVSSNPSVRCIYLQVGL
jgi:type IV pilus assembly protein PilV